MAHKHFRDFRAELVEGPETPAVAGDSKGKSFTDDPETGSPVDVGLKQLKHVRQFTKHPVALDHQFNGDRSAHGVSESVEAGGENVEKFVRAELKKMGKKDVADLSDDEKKKLFNKVDAKFKSDKEMEEGFTIIEDVFDSLKKLKKPKQQEEVKFQNGKTLTVDSQTASALVKLHDSLGSSQQKKFIKNLNTGPSAFLKVVDFALSGV